MRNKNRNACCKIQHIVLATLMLSRRVTNCAHVLCDYTGKNPAISFQVSAALDFGRHMTGCQIGRFSGRHRFVKKDRVARPSPQDASGYAICCQSTQQRRMDWTGFTTEGVYNVSSSDGLDGYSIRRSLDADNMFSTFKFDTVAKAIETPHNRAQTWKFRHEHTRSSPCPQQQPLPFDAALPGPPRVPGGAAIPTLMPEK